MIYELFKKQNEQIKLCVFCYTYCIDFCKKKYIGNVAIFDYICEKRGVFTHAAKSKKLNYFDKIFYCPFDPTKIPEKV